MPLRGRGARGTIPTVWRPRAPTIDRCHRTRGANPSGDDSDGPRAPAGRGSGDTELEPGGLATGPEPQRPCNGWPWTGGSPDMRWVLRHPPARYLRSRGIRVHHLAGSGPPHPRPAVRPPEYLHARSIALDLGS